MLVDHRRMAAGGAALTTVAYCAVSADGRTFEDQVTLDEQSIPHLRVLTDAVHAEGARGFGADHARRCVHLRAQAFDALSLSSSGGFNPPGVINGRMFKTAMSHADLERVISEFVAAARCAGRGL